MDRWRCAIAMQVFCTPIWAEPTPQNEEASAKGLPGRGINLGNMLEAPREGEWGLRLEAGYFDTIKKAGFGTVRIPIRWSAHADHRPPYAIEADFFKRVDWAVEQALSHGLAVVINVHHFDEMYRDPNRFEPMLRALWKQIAERYRKQPGRLAFELLNEPSDKLTDERWNRMIPPLLETIRATNPDRPVIVGPGHWNSLQSLDQLHLPAKDRNLMVTFHYYQPFEFTHQGASWVKGSSHWKGRRWQGTAAEVAALAKDFERAAAWAKQHERALFLGEFGAYELADMDSRARWTRAVVEQARKHGMSWAYWEFGAGFGAYDRAHKAWHKPLLAALMNGRP
jgi:endoglucanase